MAASTLPSTSLGTESSATASGASIRAVNTHAIRAILIGKTSSMLFVGEAQGYHPRGCAADYVRERTKLPAEVEGSFEVKFRLQHPYGVAVAVSVNVIVPARFVPRGESTLVNRTVTLQDVPGARFMPEQPSLST